MNKCEVLETDGKLMTGRDVAIAAILGAEEVRICDSTACNNGLCHDACM